MRRKREVRWEGERRRGRKKEIGGCLVQKGEKRGRREEIEEEKGKGKR